MAGLYDNMVFPDYEYHEFPLWIALDEEGKPTRDPYVMEGKRRVQRPGVTVNNEAEFDALMNGDAQVIAGKLETDEDVRKILYVQAAQCGAMVDKRWGTERIREAIAARRQEVAESNGARDKRNKDLIA